MNKSNIIMYTTEDGLTKIGNTLFVNSRIEKIIIPNSVKDIPENLFTGADSLKRIVLPEEVDWMGGGCLFSCGNNSDELNTVYFSIYNRDKNKYFDYTVNPIGENKLEKKQDVVKNIKEIFYEICKWKIRRI